MIYGERVRLRDQERTDFPQFVTWLNDPEVRSGLDIYLAFSDCVCSLQITGRPVVMRRWGSFTGDAYARHITKMASTRMSSL